MQASSSHGSRSAPTLRLGETRDRTRRQKLRRIGFGEDRDIFTGRFAKGGKEHMTSSTRTPIKPPLSLCEENADGNEEAMKEFIQSELSTFFATENDACLYVKALIADGIVAGFDC